MRMPLTAQHAWTATVDRARDAEQETDTPSAAPDCHGRRHRITDVSGYRAPTIRDRTIAIQRPVLTAAARKVGRRSGCRERCHAGSSPTARPGSRRRRTRSAQCLQVGASSGVRDGLGAQPDTGAAPRGLVHPTLRRVRGQTGRDVVLEPRALRCAVDAPQFPCSGCPEGRTGVVRRTWLIGRLSREGGGLGR